MANTTQEVWDYILETISWSEKKKMRKTWSELGLERKYREATYEHWYSKEIKTKLLAEQNAGLTLDEISEKHDITLSCIIKILNKK